MVAVAGGILLALAILAIGFLMIVLFISGVLAQIAWELAKWLFHLTLWLSLFPIMIWTGSGSSISALLGLCATGAIIIYLDSLDSA